MFWAVLLGFLVVIVVAIIACRKIRQAIFTLLGQIKSLEMALLSQHDQITHIDKRLQNHFSGIDRTLLDLLVLAQQEKNSLLEAQVYLAAIKGLLISLRAQKDNREFAVNQDKIH